MPAALPARTALLDLVHHALQFGIAAAQNLREPKQPDNVDEQIQRMAITVSAQDKTA